MKGHLKTDQSIQINETIRKKPGSTLFLDLLMPRDYRKQSEGCYSIVVAGKGTAERVSFAKQRLWLNRIEFRVVESSASILSNNGTVDFRTTATV
jgi:hypothetical protein